LLVLLGRVVLGMVRLLGRALGRHCRTHLLGVVAVLRNVARWRDGGGMAVGVEAADGRRMLHPVHCLSRQRLSPLGGVRLVCGSGHGLRPAGRRHAAEDGGKGGITLLVRGSGAIIALVVPLLVLAVVCHGGPRLFGR
jgi:hypothetical protein